MFAIAYFIIGFVAGAVWQGELLSVGAQYLSPPSNLLSKIVFALHKNGLMFSLPMALCAAAISSLNFERKTLRNICRYVAITLLIITVIPFIIPGFVITGWYLLIPAAALMVSVVQSFLRLFGIAPLAYSIGTGLMVLLVIGILIALRNSETSLQDTYVKLAVIHGVGIIALGLVLANLVSVVSEHRKTWVKWVFVAHALALNALGFLFVKQQLMTGFNGMPLGYLDYPREFSAGLRSISFMGLIFAALTMSISIISAIRVIRYRNRDADIFE